jgi:hypothetical protein
MDCPRMITLLAILTLLLRGALASAQWAVI